MIRSSDNRGLLPDLSTKIFNNILVNKLAKMGVFNDILMRLIYFLLSSISL